MGLLADSANGESEDPSSDPVKREEDYEKLFMKIGREFVHKSDLEGILTEMIDRIAEVSPNLGDALTDPPLDTARNMGALIQAGMYKHFLDEGIDGSEIFQDLMKLDEDEDEDE